LRVNSDKRVQTVVLALGRLAVKREVKMTSNAGVDIFGRRLGSKVSRVARLASRPEGATMLEITAATGGDKRHTKYNIFKILEAEGHTVRREGGRLFLEHKDGISIKDDAVTQPRTSSPESEHRFQTAVRSNLDKLEPGLVAIDGGREVGCRDITAKDQAGYVVVIELKVDKATADAITQLLTYMGEVKVQNPSKKVRGILVAPDFTSRAEDAASVVSDIALKRHSLSDFA
jgi:Endonuclease NucS